MTTKRNRVHIIPAVVIVGLFFLGGVSYSAESALPGDFLYFVKIQLNEVVQNKIAVTDKAKARFESRIASRRFLEIEKLAGENKLTTETLGDLHRRLDNNIKNFMEICLRIEKKDPKLATKIRSDFEVALAMYGDLLDKIQGTKVVSQKEMAELITEIEQSRRDVSNSRMRLEEKEFGTEGPDEKTSVERALLSAQNKIDQVEMFMKSKRSVKNAVVFAEADSRLKSAIGALAEGKAKLEVPAYADAFALFKKAEREALAVELFIENGEK
jgi:hypothetical protein